jgi:transposase
VLKTIQLFVVFALKITGNRGLILLDSVDWEPIEEILKQLESNRGRPLVHPNIAKLKAIIYGLANQQYSILGITRAVTKPFIAQICGFTIVPSHDTLLRFWSRLESVIEEIFQEFVRQNVDLGLIDVRRLVIDPTSIETRYLSDKDAKWSWDKSRKRYYFGYGANALVDVSSQLPLCAMFIQSKKTDSGETLALWNRLRGRLRVKPDIVVGDSEFDIIEFHEALLSEHVFPVIEYNPRNSETPLPIKYRVQQYFDVNIEWLDEEHKYRAEAEHFWSTVKEHFGLEKFHVRGWNNVKVKFFLTLIHPCKIRVR